MTISLLNNILNYTRKYILYPAIVITQILKYTKNKRRHTQMQILKYHRKQDSMKIYLLFWYENATSETTIDSSRKEKQTRCNNDNTEHLNILWQRNILSFLHSISRLRISIFLFISKKTLRQITKIQNFCYWNARIP